MSENEWQQLSLSQTIPRNPSCGSQLPLILRARVGDSPATFSVGTRLLVRFRTFALEISSSLVAFFTSAHIAS